MKRVNIIIPQDRFSSFAYVGKVLAQLIIGLMDNNTPISHLSVTSMYITGALNILIDDAYITVNTPKVSDIAWIDTALEINTHRISRQCEIWVCSERDKQQLERIGLKVSKVMPRPFNPLAYALRKKPMKKEYDVFICGWYREPDRKNFRYVKELVDKLGLKCVAITNYPLLNRYDFASVDDLTKYTLIKKSKFVLHLAGIEGFGMPPFEGMAMGIPTIYLDTPAVNEWAIGLKIPVESWVTHTINLGLFNAVMKFAIPKMDEALEIVKYALNMGKEEYEDLSHKAMEKADELMGKVLATIHNIII